MAPPGLRIFAVGDIHGRSDCLDAMLALIDADCAASPPRERLIVFLGDYADRGPDSAGVLQRLSGLLQRADVVCLRGNHDDWLEDFLLHPDAGEAFLQWGGVQTLASYGVDAAPSRSPAEMASELARAMPPAHRQFLRRLRHRHEAGDFFFCHAGVRPGIALNEQDPFDLMWIRREFHDHTDSFGKIIVHGHTPNSEVEIRRNRINVDTRAYETGVLSCVVLEGNTHRILQTSERRGL